MVHKIFTAKMLVSMGSYCLEKALNNERRLEKYIDISRYITSAEYLSQQFTVKCYIFHTAVIEISTNLSMFEIS